MATHHILKIGNFLKFGNCYYALNGLQSVTFRPADIIWFGRKTTKYEVVFKFQKGIINNKQRIISESFDSKMEAHELIDYVLK